MFYLMPNGASAGFEQALDKALVMRGEFSSGQGESAKRHVVFLDEHREQTSMPVKIQFPEGAIRLRCCGEVVQHSAEQPVDLFAPDLFDSHPPICDTCMHVFLPSVETLYMALPGRRIGRRRKRG